MRSLSTSIVENAADAILTTDSAGTITSWNKAAEQIYGYFVAEVIGKNISLLTPQEQSDDSLAPREVPYQGVKIQKCKDGTLLTVLVSVSALRDDRGKNTGLVVIARKIADDLTERKKAEKKLHLVVEAAPTGILMVNRAGTILLVNAQVEKLFGYTREQLLNKSIEILVPERFRDNHSGYMVEFFDQQRPRLMGVGRDLYGLRQNGSEFPVEIGLNPIETEDGILVMAGIIDITERKRVEEEVRKLNAELGLELEAAKLSAQKLREQATLLDIASDAIFVRDMRHDIVYWNKSAERIYGWSFAEAIGKNADDLLGTHAPDELHAYEIVLEKGEWAGEFNRKSKDGRELAIQARWTAVRDPQGKPRGILAVNTDITEQRSIQRQLLRAQRLESIGTLAGGVAHDLNNILAPILMGVEALAIQCGESSQKILGIMKTAAQRGANIVQQVLSFARGIEGEQAEVQLKHLIREVEQLIRETFPKIIEIRSQVPKDLMTVMGETTQLHQVLMNLCVNARDAMPDGGILTLSAENVELDETYARMNIEARPIRYVALKVEDTGTGIAPGILEKIFDPFFTTKGLLKGTGLGLSTAHSIAKAHGGFINVYSEVGKGSAFKVYIPAADQGQADRVEKVPEGIPMGEGELILVVDDEAAVREITKQILESYGYQVLLAKDGTEAVVHYAEKRGQIRVVLTDMMMPFMDGAATIRALRRIDATVKIISTSGLATPGQAKEAAGLGVDAFLAKPYTAEALLEKLRNVLGAAQCSAPE